MLARVSLLYLILAYSTFSSAQEPRWPYNLPPHVKYYPEHEARLTRDIKAQERLRTDAPVGLKKMSGDPGEKFWFDYWHFEAGEYYSINVSALVQPDTCLPRHNDGLSRRHMLRFIPSPNKRDFQCPTGSQPCTSIGRGNSCCAMGSTCQLIQDTGYGDVGCCPPGQACGTRVASCPAGYTTCPKNIGGGGCCLPGYACYDVGCVRTSTVVVTVVPSLPSTTSIFTTVATNIAPPATVTETSTTIVEATMPPPTSTYVPPATTILTTSIAVSSPSTVTSVTVTTQTSIHPPTTTLPAIIPTPPQSSTCSPGFQSCPASLGGGCCPTDRACGNVTCPPLSSSSSGNSLTAPARPTSVSQVTTSTSLTSVPSYSGCPTGFYACSAYYQGGCCQIGRDCAVLSCPANASTTVAGNSGVTVVAPAGNGITSVPTSLTGTCPTGWSTCAPSVGGGCCATGYACQVGLACSATGPGGQGSEIGKIAPQSRAGSLYGRIDVGRVLVIFSMAMML